MVSLGFLQLHLSRRGLVELEEGRSCHCWDVNFEKLVFRSLDVVERLEVDEVIKSLNIIFENGDFEEYINKLASDS